MGEKRSIELDVLSYTDMAYDDAFRTMETKCDDLLIPYVNYVFGERFDTTAKVKRLRNEQFIENEDHSTEKRITDSHFEIIQGDIRKCYHLECESKVYGRSILVRIFEYDAQIALDNAEMDISEIRVRFPYSGLLLLRGSLRSPDKGRVIIDTPEGEISYGIPITKMSAFSIDDIFEKRLFLLIPFYIFNFEKDLEAINTDEVRLQKLTDVYRDILDRLEGLHKCGSLSTYSYGVIISLARSVMQKLTDTHTAAQVQQKVGDIMGGKVLDLPIIRVYENGKKEGEAIGEAKGRREGEAIGEAERQRLAADNERLRKELEQLRAAQG